MTLTALKNALTSTIDGDSTYAALNTGGTHSIWADTGTSSPWTTLLITEWGDEYTLNKRVGTVYRVDITCWTQELDANVITTMTDRLDAFLTDGTFTVSGKKTMLIRRTGGREGAEQLSTTTFINITSSFLIELTDT